MKAEPASRSQLSNQSVVTQKGRMRSGHHSQKWLGHREGVFQFTALRSHCITEENQDKNSRQEPGSGNGSRGHRGTLRIGLQAGRLRYKLHSWQLCDWSFRKTRVPTRKMLLSLTNSHYKWQKLLDTVAHTTLVAIQRQAGRSPEPA